MGEYGRKQRNQLSKTISHSESNSSQLRGFVDNRPQSVGQTKLIDSIQKKPNDTGMPDNLKPGVENLSGNSMDDVKGYYKLDKPTQLQALAYTQGTDIHVAPGQEQYLPHETWHVAQQMAGRVEPTTEVAGMPVNNNAALEHEADVMGAKAVQMKSIGVQDYRLKNDKNKAVINLAVQRECKGQAGFKFDDKRPKWHCKDPGNKNSEPIKQFYNKSMKTVPFPIQRVVDLYRSRYIWKTPGYDQDIWYQGQRLYQAPTAASQAVTTAVSDELLDGVWFSGHMINGTLAGGHGRPDNTEPITSGLNHSMTSLENQANAVAADRELEYKYMMEGSDDTHTWSRIDDPEGKVTNLITEYRGTLSTRTRGRVIPGRMELDQFGKRVRTPNMIIPPVPLPNVTGQWQMDVRDGITES